MGARRGFLLASVIMLPVLLAGCMMGHQGHGVPPLPADFSDIHGLAVHSSRPDEVYAATHTGLMRMVGDADWARVGTSEADLMGFSMHPEDGDILWASGHPPRGGNLGVIHSTDGGVTWDELALPGVDFHAMTVSPADPDRLWGSYNARLYRSDDGGKTWDKDIGSSPYSALVAHPEEADTLYGVSRRGFFKSEDAGATFTVARDLGTSAFGISPHDTRFLYLGVGPNLHRSVDGGQSWQVLDLNVTGGTILFVAFHPVDDRIAYVATGQVGIYKTDDKGETWTTVREPR